MSKFDQTVGKCVLAKKGGFDPWLFGCLTLHALWHATTLVRDFEDHMDVALLQLHSHMWQAIRSGAPGKLWCRFCGLKAGLRSWTSAFPRWI